MQFGWSISRLWQLLKNRKKEKYIRVFLGIDYWECNAHNLKKKHIPEELKKSLSNNNSEEINFFDKYLRLLQFVWRGWEESKQRFSPFPRVATPCNSRISAGPCPACSSCS